MNETELRDVFEALTRDPVPSRYDTESVHTASARRQRRKWSAGVGIVVTGAVIAGTAFLFGHGDSREASPAGPQAEQIVLDGKWQVVALNLDDGRSLLNGVKAGAAGDSARGYLEFHAGQVTLTNICHTYSGSYKQSGDHGRDLVFRVPNTLDFAHCFNDAPVRSRLEAVRHVDQSQDVLQLQNASDKNIVTLERVNTKPVPVDLAGNWKVTALLGADGRSVLASDKVRIRFSGGTLAGDTECNRVNGDYAQSGEDGRDLIFANLQTSWVGCTESPVTSPLRAVRHVTESSGVLYLQAEDGQNVATLERVRSTPKTVEHYEPCDGGSIRVYAHVGVGLGTKGVRLTVTRTSGEPCVLPAYPRKVEFSYRDALLSLPTTLDPLKPAGSAVLFPGSRATAMLQWANWCAPEVHNDRISFWIGKRRFDVLGFGTSPYCEANSGASGGESLNIRSPITIGFFATYRRVGTSTGAAGK